MTIQELKRQKKALVKSMRISRERNKDVVRRMREFKTSVKRFPKNEIDLYLEVISKMCLDVDAKYQTLNK